MATKRWWSRGVLAALLLALAAGCGGSGGGGKKKPKDSESLDPITDALADDDIRHFLSRTHFASSEVGVQAVKATGLQAYVQQMLDVQPNPALEAAALAEIADPMFPGGNELSRYWLHLMVNNPNPFQEVMGLFWHDHFAVSRDVLSSEERYWMVSHINLMRNNAVANLKAFMWVMAVDWAMLDFLDGIRSTGSNPNENFARELWELYTLGRDVGYTQEDIEEAARCFTGFRARLDGGTGQRYIEFDPARHDDGDKTIFGRTLQGKTGAAGEEEYADVVNLTFDQRPVAEFLGRKIFEYFCYEDPSKKMIDKVAKILKDSNYDVKPLLETIFLSKAFYSDRAKKGLVKNPVDHAVGFIRTTGLEIPLANLDGSLFATAMRPTQPPDVNGWPRGSLWLSSQGMVERANLVRFCIVSRTYQSGLGIDVAALLPPVGQRSALEVVEELERLMRLDLDDTERTLYVDYLNTNRDASGATIPEPFDGNDPGQIDEKLRGLLYIMAQHPTYHIR